MKLQVSEDIAPYYFGVILLFGWISPILIGVVFITFLFHIFYRLSKEDFTEYYVPSKVTKVSINIEEKQAYMKSKKWYITRIAVLKRDNYECYICSKQVPLEVHHLTYKHIYNEPLEDLVSLCRRCHQAQHNHYGYKYTTNYIKLVGDKFMTERFKQLHHLIGKTITMEGIIQKYGMNVGTKERTVCFKDVLIDGIHIDHIWVNYSLYYPQGTKQTVKAKVLLRNRPNDNVFNTEPKKDIQIIIKDKHDNHKHQN